MCNNKNLRKQNPSPRSLMSTMLRLHIDIFKKLPHIQMSILNQIVLLSILLERIEKLHKFLFQNQKHITSHLPYCQRNKKMAHSCKVLNLFYFDTIKPLACLLVHAKHLERLHHNRPSRLTTTT